MQNTESFSYKNLIVYQKAKELSYKALKYFYSAHLKKTEEFLIDQLLRSACSIAANIAEGYGRHYQKNFRQFLSIARASSFELDY